MWHLSDDDLAAKTLRLRRRSGYESIARRRLLRALPGAWKAPGTRSRRDGADDLHQRRYRGLPPTIVCRSM